MDIGLVVLKEGNLSGYLVGEFDVGVHGLRGCGVAGLGL